MGLAGMYRINTTEFPAPETTQWEENVIGEGLNGLLINSSYRKHRWRWQALDGTEVEKLFALFAAQQAGTTPISILETDPYPADLANEDYGTTTYSDVVLKVLSPRIRGLPLYDDVIVEFEVFVA